MGDRSGFPGSGKCVVGTPVSDVVASNTVVTASEGYLGKVEGSIGYAHWVCSSLVPNKPPENHVILKGKPVSTLSHLHPEYRKAVLQSGTALSKYTGIASSLL
ncbi:Tetratricopeptide repeat protein 37 [Desmophyllum pertusum]|uniref:Tetratricopeptide repeat protein 37 n=1 Tax=Desmophyllum pertusum TaxID=174260 RepID=A0A9W9YV39_9CNID|nr:Tetratricopeptide repeat protein 37 [Desmophyllum pertusum]